MLENVLCSTVLFFLPRPRGLSTERPSPPRMRTQLLLLAVGCGVSHALHAGPAALSPPQSVKRAAPLSPSLASSARPSSAPRADALRLKGGSDQVRRAPPPHSTRGGATTMSRTKAPKLKPCAASAETGAASLYLQSVQGDRGVGDPVSFQLYLALDR